MRDAQIGLLIATPLVAAIAVALHRAGALSRAGAAVAIGMSITIALVLFLSH